jgi:hypothetical protein
MADKWTPRQVVKNRIKTAVQYSVKILHELDEIQKIYGDTKHKNQAYIQVAVEYNILNRDMLENLRIEL